MSEIKIETIISHSPRSQIYKGQYGWETVAIKMGNRINRLKGEKKNFEHLMNFQCEKNNRSDGNSRPKNYPSDITIIKNNYHPGIIKFYQSMIFNFQGKDRYALIFEYVDGSDLHQYFFGSRSSPNVPICLPSIIRQILAALDFLHSREIVHLDVKLENVVYSSSGDRAVIIDFDLSLSKKDFNLPLAWRGTREYVSPEFYDGKIETFEQLVFSDVWAIGILIFVVLFQKYPDSTYPISNQIETFSQTTPVNEIPFKLFKIMKTALQLDWKNRRSPKDLLKY